MEAETQEEQLHERSAAPSRNLAASRRPPLRFEQASVGRLKRNLSGGIRPARGSLDCLSVGGRGGGSSRNHDGGRHGQRHEHLLHRAPPPQGPPRPPAPDHDAHLPQHPRHGLRGPPPRGPCDEAAAAARGLAGAGAGGRGDQGGQPPVEGVPGDPGGRRHQRRPGARRRRRPWSADPVVAAAEPGRRPRPAQPAAAARAHGLRLARRHLRVGGGDRGGRHAAGEAGVAHPRGGGGQVASPRVHAQAGGGDEDGARDRRGALLVPGPRRAPASRLAQGGAPPRPPRRQRVLPDAGRVAGVHEHPGQLQDPARRGIHAAPQGRRGGHRGRRRAGLLRRRGGRRGRLPRQARPGAVPLRRAAAALHPRAVHRVRQLQLVGGGGPRRADEVRRGGQQAARLRARRRRPRGEAARRALGGGPQEPRRRRRVRRRARAGDGRGGGGRRAPADGGGLC